MVLLVKASIKRRSFCHSIRCPEDVEQQLSIDCQDQSVLGGPAGAAYWNQQELVNCSKGKSSSSFRLLTNSQKMTFVIILNGQKMRVSRIGRLTRFLLKLNRLEIELPETSDDGLTTLSIDSKTSSLGKAGPSPNLSMINHASHP